MARPPPYPLTTDHAEGGAVDETIRDIAGTSARKSWKHDSAIRMRDSAGRAAIVPKPEPKATGTSVPVRKRPGDPRG